MALTLLRLIASEVVLSKRSQDYGLIIPESLRYPLLNYRMRRVANEICLV